MKATTLAKLERRIRAIAVLLPPKFVVSTYSKGRLDFLKKLEKDIPEYNYIPDEKYSRVLWNIKFRSPIMNAAGMFKNAESYNVVARQGAAAYLGGTGTWNPRQGNEKEGVYLAFAPYPRSHSASNWLGLPNDGDEINSKRAKNLDRISDCPIGWSIMGSPDLKGEEKLKYLVNGMKLYEKAGIDFLEINESCPNTAHGKPQDDNLVNRLKYIKEHFLDQRTRNLPAIVKFSNDTKVEQISMLLDILFEFGFDGVNFGNTSTDYERRRKEIAESEKKLYDFFTKTFGGGVSGKPLKESSLELASRAVQYLNAGKPQQEFHIIRTGGIETLKDILDSEQAGISLNQWFTGYFENFSLYGHDLYRKLLEEK